MLSIRSVFLRDYGGVGPRLAALAENGQSQHFISLLDARASILVARSNFFFFTACAWSRRGVAGRRPCRSKARFAAVVPPTLGLLQAQLVGSGESRWPSRQTAEPSVGSRARSRERAGQALMPRRESEDGRVWVLDLSIATYGDAWLTPHKPLHRQLLSPSMHESSPSDSAPRHPTAHPTVAPYSPFARSNPLIVAHQPYLGYRLLHV